MEFIELPELTDTDREKVCIIKDINKLNILLIKRRITAKEFDILIDSDVDYLEQIHQQLHEAVLVTAQFHRDKKEFGDWLRQEISKSARGGFPSTDEQQ